MNKLIRLNLDERQAKILAAICGLDIDVPKVVVNHTSLFAEERELHARTIGKRGVESLRGEQKLEVSRLLDLIRYELVDTA